MESSPIRRKSLRQSHRNNGQLMQPEPEVDFRDNVSVSPPPSASPIKQRLNNGQSQMEEEEYVSLSSRSKRTRSGLRKSASADQDTLTLSTSISTPSPLPSPNNSSWATAGRLRDLRPSSPADTILLDDTITPTNSTTATPLTTPTPTPLKKTRKRARKEEPEDVLLCEYESRVCGSRGTIPISVSDVLGLKPDGHISSRIVDFWLSYYCNEGIHPIDQRKIAVFSGLSYPYLEQHLKKGRGWRGSDNGLGSTSTPLSLTKGVADLFLKDYIFIPIPLEVHWFLAVICYPGMVLEIDEDVAGEENVKEEEEEGGEGKDNISDLLRLLKRRKLRRDLRGTPTPSPMILILDSLQSYGINHKSCAGVFRRFLNKEWEHRYPGRKFEFTKTNITLHVLDVPQQDNGSECGLFMLRFFEKIFSYPIPRAPPFPTSLCEDWSKPEDQYYGKRSQIYDTICQLMAHDPENARALFMPVIDFTQNQEDEEEDKYVEDEDLANNVSKSSDNREDLEKSILKDWDYSDDEDVYVPLVQRKRYKSKGHKLFNISSFVG